MKKTTLFGPDALERIQEALWAFHYTLMKRAAARAEKAGRKRVTLEDVEKTEEGLVRDKKPKGFAVNLPKRR